MYLVAQGYALCHHFLGEFYGIKTEHYGEK